MAKGRSLTEVIGLLKKIVSAPITMAQNMVYGSDNVRKAKLHQLRTKRHALVSKLNQIRRAQKAQGAGLKKSKSILKDIDAQTGTNTHDDIFGKDKKSKEPKVSRMPKTPKIVTNKPKKRKPK